jgi:RNA polymerase-binding transcription factor DksA
MNRDENNPLYKAVVETRKAVDDALARVPDDEYGCCDDAGKEAYTELSVALNKHRKACREWRHHPNAINNP